MNKVILGGRLANDVELRSTKDGKKYANIILNCSNDDNAKTFVYMECVLWGESANRLSNSAKKGTYILADGRLNKSSYEGKNGKVWVTNVTIEKFEILENFVEEKPTTSEETSYTPQDSNNGVLDYDDGDLPF